MGMGVVNAFGLYYVVDATGMVLECAGSAYPDTVAGPKINNLILDDNSRVTVGERLPVRDSGQLAAVQRVLAALDSTDMLGRVSLLDVKNLDNMYLMTTDGARIVLGDDAKLETKLLIAREVLVVREPLGTVKGREDRRFQRQGGALHPQHAADHHPRSDRDADDCALRNARNLKKWTDLEQNLLKWVERTGIIGYNKLA